MKRILVVEDEPWLAESYVDAIKAAGYEAQYAHDAAMAIDMVDDIHPDLVLLDIMLPNASGLQLLHELRSHADLVDTPVIICSNAVSQLNSAQLKNYGIIKILDKARLTPHKLTIAVTEALS
jgi:DNA-binding response OmpR family regulator